MFRGHVVRTRCIAVWSGGRENPVRKGLRRLERCEMVFWRWKLFPGRQIISNAGAGLDEFRTTGIGLDLAPEVTNVCAQVG